MFLLMASIPLKDSYTLKGSLVCGLLDCAVDDLIVISLGLYFEYWRMVPVIWYQALWCMVSLVMKSVGCTHFYQKKKNGRFKWLANID